jgi:hypothetical protein
VVASVVASLMVAVWAASLVVATVASGCVAGAVSAVEGVDAGFDAEVVAGCVEGGLLTVAAGTDSGLVPVSGSVGLVVAGAAGAGRLPTSSVVTSAVRVAATELSADPAPALSPPPQPASAPAETQTSSSTRTQHARVRVLSGRVADAVDRSTIGSHDDRTAGRTQPPLRGSPG